MNRLLTYLILIIVVTAIAGCGEAIEIQKTFFPNGSIESEVSISEGTKNGSFTYYWENGKIERTGVFVNDSLDGLIVFYSKNGVDTSRTSLYVKGNLVESIDYMGASVKIKADFKNRLTTIYDTSGEVDTVINMK